MKYFFQLFFGAAIPMALVIFASSISNNTWQRSLGLAVIFAFLFGSLFAQVITVWQDKQKEKEATPKKKTTKGDS